MWVSIWRRIERIFLSIPIHPHQCSAWWRGATGNVCQHTLVRKGIICTSRACTGECRPQHSFNNWNGLSRFFQFIAASLAYTSAQPFFCSSSPFVIIGVWSMSLPNQRCIRFSLSRLWLKYCSDLHLQGHLKVGISQHAFSVIFLAGFILAEGVSLLLSRKNIMIIYWIT